MLVVPLLVQTEASVAMAAEAAKMAVEEEDSEAVAKMAAEDRPARVDTEVAVAKEGETAEEESGP